MFLLFIRHRAKRSLKIKSLRGEVCTWRGSWVGRGYHFELHAQKVKNMRNAVLALHISSNSQNLTAISKANNHPRIKFNDTPEFVKKWARWWYLFLVTNFTAHFC